MATYGGGIRVNTSVAASGGVSRGQNDTGTVSATLYTCPANSYAILNLIYSASYVAAGSTGAWIYIGAQPVIYLDNSVGTWPTIATQRGEPRVIYVGPGQSVRIEVYKQGTGAGTNVSMSAWITGVELINS